MIRTIPCVLCDTREDVKNALSQLFNTGYSKLYVKLFANGYVVQSTKDASAYEITDVDFKYRIHSILYKIMQSIIPDVELSIKDGDFLTWSPRVVGGVGTIDVLDMYPDLPNQYVTDVLDWIEEHQDSLGVTYEDINMAIEELRLYRVFVVSGYDTDDPDSQLTVRMYDEYEHAFPLGDDLICLHGVSKFDLDKSVEESTPVANSKFVVTSYYPTYIKGQTND